MHRIQVGGARYGMIKDENQIQGTMKKEREQLIDDDDSVMGFAEEASTIFGFRQNGAEPPIIKSETS